MSLPKHNLEKIDDKKILGNLPRVYPMITDNPNITASSLALSQKTIHNMLNMDLPEKLNSQKM